MREDTNWFAKWEEELPSPEELMPLSQTLITPDLAAAFEITTTTTTTTTTTHQTLPPPPPPPLQPDFDSADEPARTLKRPRLVWTPQLHKRFVDAVAHLGIKNAVPKTIMQLMNVDGLTRENVASHLQKYRLYLKRMQGLSSDSAASACDHLFATTPVPHFLHHPPDDHHLLPFVAPPPLHHHHHHHHVAAAVHNHQQQHFGGGVAFGSPPAAVQFDHRYLTRHHQPLHRIIPPGAQFVGGVEELGSTSPPTPGSPPGSGRKVLTLFPTAEG